MTMKTVRWGIAGLVVAAAAGLAWWSLRGGEGGVAYRSAKIERGGLQAVVSASGLVNPVTQVSVGSQVSGQIKELRVDFNSVVRQGELIARIDPETFEYRVRQSSADVDAARSAVLTAQAGVRSALASLAKARVDVAQARRDLEQKKGLVAQQFIAPSEVDKAQASVDMLEESVNVAQAQVEVARAQAGSAESNVKQREALLAQARIDLERTQIRSPVDGIVIKRSIEAGQTVAASLQAPELFVIARNLDDMQVEAAIDESDISRVKTGQKVSFTIDAFPGRGFEGQVGQVRKAAVSAQNVVTYTVVVRFSNPDASVLPGMTANVRIATDTRDAALKVPNAALRVRIAGIEPAAASASAPAAASAARAGRAAARGRVYVLGDDGKPRACDVRTGISDGAMTELLVGPQAPCASALVEGASVVTAVLGAGATSAGGSPRTPSAGPRPF
jgi:HlyD family secretion protein